MSDANAKTDIPTGHDAPRNPLDELADSFVARLRRGERPSIAQYVRMHPELENDIREMFPTLAMLEQAGGNDSQIARVISEAIPKQLGEYRILGKIGHGGMGVVYEAEHATMRRRVALKVMPAGAAVNPTHLRRFHREARAAGRLHHTNIVPVFEVGEHSGVHYYAMQYIRGQSLDLVIEELVRLQAARSAAGGAFRDLDPAAPMPRQTGNADELSRSIALGLVAGQFEPPVSPPDIEEPAAQADPFRGRPEPPDGPGAVSPSDKIDPATCNPGGVAPVCRAASAADPERNRVDSTADGVAGAMPQPAYSSADILSQSGDFTESATLRRRYFYRVARIGLQVAEALEHAHNQRVLHRDIKPANLILDTAGVAWVTDFGLAKHDNENVTGTGDLVGTMRYMAPERLNGKGDARSDTTASD